MSSRVQMYLQKHEITSLFEELMNKVIRDSPKNPIIYLIKQLYRKAGLSIPLELKSGLSLSKTTPDFTIHGQSTEIVSKSAALASWSRKPDEFRAVSAPVNKDKSHMVKPGLQKEKAKFSLPPKKLTEADSADFTEPAKLKISQVSPIPCSKKKTSARTTTLIYPRHASLDDFMQMKKTADPKEKPSWNGDTKVKSGTFEESAADMRTSGSKSLKSLKSEPVPLIQDSRKSWAMIGLNDATGDSFQDGCYTGPKVTQRLKIKEDDILSEERVLSNRQKYYKEEPTTRNTSVYTGRIGTKQAVVEKHKADLEKLLKEKKKHFLVSSKTASDAGYDDIDSAVELLENPADLISEGVNKLPPVGYKLSKTLHHREEDAQVKLNINLYSGVAPSEIGSAISRVEESSEYDQESIGRTHVTSQSVRFDDSDEDFDSASQVASSTQKMPHWDSKHFNGKSADGETYSLGRTPSPQPPLQERHTFLSKSVTIQEPIRTNSPITDRLRLSAPPLSASVPVMRTSTNSENLSINNSLSPREEQSVRKSQNLVELKTSSYGWEFSDDSDGSILSAHSTHRRTKKLPKGGY